MKKNVKKISCLDISRNKMFIAIGYLLQFFVSKSNRMFRRTRNPRKTENHPESRLIKLPVTNGVRFECISFTIIFTLYKIKESLEVES